MNICTYTMIALILSSAMTQTMDNSKTTQPLTSGQYAAQDLAAYKKALNEKEKQEKAAANPSTTSQTPQTSGQVLTGTTVTAGYPICSE